MALSWLLRPLPPERLATSRFLFYAWYALQVGLYNPAAYARLPRQLWEPVLLLRPFGAPSPWAAQLAVAVLMVALVGSALGRGRRLAPLAVALVGPYAVGLMSSYGTASFHFTPLILISWILALSDSREEGANGWTVRLAWLTLVLPMATAGLQKLMGSWPGSPAETIDWFLRDKYWIHASVKNHPLHPLVLWPLAHPGVMAGMAYATLLLELGCPLALLDRPGWLRPFFIGGLFLLQFVLAVVFNTLSSFPWLAAYFFWIPWERLQAGGRSCSPG